MNTLELFEIMCNVDVSQKLKVSQMFPLENDVIYKYLYYKPAELVPIIYCAPESFRVWGQGTEP